MSMKESSLLIVADDITPNWGGGAHAQGAINTYPGRCIRAAIFRKQGHAKSKDDGQGWERTEISDTLNIFDNSEGRTPILICQSFDV